MDIQNAKELGAVVRKLRLERGLTQAGLAQKAGVGREWIIHLEKGRNTLELGLALRTLKALSVILRVEPEPPGGTGIDLDRFLKDTHPGSEP